MRFLVVFIFQVSLCCWLHEANVMYCVLFVDSGGFPFMQKVAREMRWLLGLPEDWPWVICRVVDIYYVGDSEDKCLHHLCYSSCIWWRYVHFYIYD
jgi:hypothetical protein